MSDNKSILVIDTLEHVQSIHTVSQNYMEKTTWPKLWNLMSAYEMINHVIVKKTIFYCSLNQE